MLIPIRQADTSGVGLTIIIIIGCPFSAFAGHRWNTFAVLVSIWIIGILALFRVSRLWLWCRRWIRRSAGAARGTHSRHRDGLCRITFGDLDSFTAPAVETHII